MSKKAHETALPKLRFPEFWGKGEWVEKKLGELTYPISERNKKDKKLPVYSISNINGFVPQSSQFEGVDSHERGYDVTLYKIVGKNTFAYNPARINIGSIGYSGELSNVLISSLYVCLKTNDDLNDLFFWHFVKSAAFNQAVNDTVEGGIRSYLFYENLATIKIKIPSLLEQQKIADALSSLDALFTAQTAKLTALQAHKRGLMQDLFPGAGETVPKRRFLEFQDAGDWAERKLGNLVNISSGYSPSTYTLAEHGEYAFLQVEDLNNCEKYQITSRKYGNDSVSVVPKGSVIFPKRGAAILNNKVRVNTKSVLMDTNLMALTPNNQIYVEFLYYMTVNIGLYKIADTSTIPQINNKHIIPFNVTIPILTEQKKIADCLSSLDNLITAQSQKLEALKLHKKGLMQALFPAASEPAA